MLRTTKGLDDQKEIWWVDNELDFQARQKILAADHRQRPKDKVPGAFTVPFALLRFGEWSQCD
jgi:hypothetical protein